MSIYWKSEISYFSLKTFSFVAALLIFVTALVVREVSHQESHEEHWHGYKEHWMRECGSRSWVLGKGSGWTPQLWLKSAILSFVFSKWVRKRFVVEKEKYFKNFYTWHLCSLFKDIEKWSGLRTSIGWDDFGFSFISKRIMVDDTNALPSSYKSFCFNFLCSLTPNTSFCSINIGTNYNYSYSTKYIEINFNVHTEKFLEVNHDYNKKSKLWITFPKKVKCVQFNIDNRT